MSPAVDVVGADLLKPETLPDALRGVRTAYYLVHSMASGAAFEESDRIAAKNFAAAAKAAGIERIIYLGGLGSGDPRKLSPHLRSRQEVGALLRSSGVPVIEFRASIVIGSGSLSFEMIRALVERLPIMITPRWVQVPAQPIAVDDLLTYLIKAADATITEGRIFEIGGADTVSYLGLMREYARQRGLKRLMIPVPVLTPWLSSLWLGLVTPLFARIGRALIESIRHSTVVTDDSARRFFGVEPVGHRQAIAAALSNEDEIFAATRWTDALGPAAVSARATRTFGNRRVDARSLWVDASPESVFAVVRRIGGANGWYFADRLWQLRGALDLLAGGVGLRRGRRDPDALRVGDVIDCWRVEAIEPLRRLRLAAEMRLPGRAWLEFEVVAERGGSRLTQTAVFDPSGLWGLAYWYGVGPLHALIFSGMLKAIARRAQQRTGS